MTSVVLGVDPAVVADWIERLGIAFTGPLSFERIGLGQSNLTYLVRDADDREWVLRRPRWGSCWRRRTTWPARRGSCRRCRTPRCPRQRSTG
ncbi:putative phosphotransferase domain protein [Mycobacterium xenopi 4042]|uniref:Putative phosphotransferase domain protein n=1 Tax=Mycobacterium xenopi 4042 TaxID=1299334 RepID=X8CFG0_MYCXE|nr:putative phosphotransferase domain protein [Mycobacterium xenopi 3993]EUA54556.1 putative phosphotransferase domain protein [Mycobacterium xenopi 4042]